MIIFKFIIAMRKKIQILFALLALSFYCVQAQVLIGANKSPHEGAVLELESNGNQGLLLPKVSLTDVTIWGLSGSAVEGMLVFNENGIFTNGLGGKGIYVWLSDGKWHLKNEIFPVPPVPGTIMLTPSSSIKKNTLFTASVPTIPGVLYYEWVIPGGILGFSNTNVINLVGITANTNPYVIQVRAINSSGTGGYQIASVTISN
jgi:hypothetical protein